ncbi:uncharacterized protein LOC101852805 [Aplysia californica]|uniref:Prohibitin n=1 Tax=Aplysia californica TaxID=6500 RepID=A0ABM1ABV9_APLCA|nr:uncharacterized protein LOC101852805 [Aplysia californica]
MDKKVLLVIVAVIAILVLAISLVASSLEKLSSKEVGLQYDTIQKDLEDKVYTEGLHLGPVGFEFIVFPNIYTTMKFTGLECLNSDGVRIELDVTYQYRVQMQHLKEVVLTFKDFDDYETVLRSVGTASLHESCSYFNTTQFQANRGEFQDKLAEILTERYSVLKSDVEDLQVNNIKRPSEYESAIRSKERAKENIAVAKEERPRLVTEANTTLREAVSEAVIITDKAESDARIRKNLARAEAEAIIELYNKEAEAYEAIMGSGGLQFSPEGFISYMGVRVIADAKNPVYIGMKSPAKASYIKD